MGAMASQITSPAIVHPNVYSSADTKHHSSASLAFVWGIHWGLLFWQFFFKNFGCVSSRSNTILAISHKWLLRLMGNEKEVHRLDTGHSMWHLTLTSLMTLTLDVSRSNFEIPLTQESLVWLMWNENEVSWYDTGPIVWPCLWPHPCPRPWNWNFKARVWNSLISGMGRPIDMERKGCESSIHDQDID